MAREGSGRAGCSRRAGARGGGPWRPPTWEVSDSDGEGLAGAEADATACRPVEERRAAAEERRAVAEALRPEQALRRVAVRVDAALLEDAGADILLEALRALGCEYHVEPQRPARSLRWTRAKPDPCPRTVPSEVWAADEQDVLLLLEPEEFLQGIQQLTQTRGPSCSVPWICPESSTNPHLAVVGLDAYLWSHQPSSQEMRQPESTSVARAAVALSWPKVEELWAHLDVLLVASWQELSQHVCAFTKALAQRPFRAMERPHKPRGQGGQKQRQMPTGDGRKAQSTPPAWNADPPKAKADPLLVRGDPLPTVKCQGRRPAHWGVNLANPLHSNPPPTTGQASEPKGREMGVQPPDMLRVTRPPTQPRTPSPLGDRQASNVSRAMPWSLNTSCIS
ncbi:probable crossover junction endonuclease EME2 isoform X2 [Mirounga angustirostris]|uniref:probable crossover junction endonuclease EME2 isoform X2 n=1 Tax=Mirounga angustirostris TaxID=9716 RepID=UPI00313DAEBB